MRRNDLVKALAFFAIVGFAVGAAGLLAPKVIGRGATFTELAILGVALTVVAAWSHARATRRQRQKLEAIRDSALW